MTEIDSDVEQIKKSLALEFSYVKEFENNLILVKNHLDLLKNIHKNMKGILSSGRVIREKITKRLYERLNEGMIVMFRFPFVDGKIYALSVLIEIQILSPLSNEF